MAIEEKNFLDPEGLAAYDAELKKYIDKLLAKQAQEIISTIQEEENSVSEFFDE